MGKRMKIRVAIAALVIVGLAAGITAWYAMKREMPQPSWVTAQPRSNFLYGWVASDGSRGLPYWIWLVLPRIFPEYVGKPGGYAAFGVPWEEGREMPAGFAKKTIGYVRVSGNCALCHATSHPQGPDEAPAVFAVGAGPRTNVAALLTFFSRCAQDPRFTADDILGEINMMTKLSLLDRLLYRYVLIPRTRRALLDPRSVIFDSALRQHSDKPRSSTPEFRQRMNALQNDLGGPEKDALVQYLKNG